MNALNTLTVTMALVFAGQTLVFAQNPLRAAPQGDWRQNQSQPTGASAQFVDSQSSRRIGNYHAGDRQRLQSQLELPPIHDDRVAQASYQQVPNIDNNTDARRGGTSSGRQPAGSLIGSASELPKQNQVLDLVMKISLNLAFVLSFAVGVILIAKKWVKPRSFEGSSERVAGDMLSVRETLRLDAKTSIRLVQWRSNRFLVACDQNGIQSVNALNASFDQTLEELDDDAMDDKLLKKLLANLDLKNG